MILWIKKHLLTVVLTLLLGLELVRLASVNHGGWDTFANSGRPNGGMQQSLSNSVRAASQLLALLRVDQFDLAPEIRANPYLLERIIEYNYPARFRDGAAVVLAPASEPYLNRGKTLIRTNYFVVYERTDAER